MDRLEDKTKEMIGVMTGGDSICYLTGNMGTQSFPNQLDPVWVVHHGRYPLYGVHIRICDVDKLNALISNRTMWDEVVAQSEQHATVEVLVPGHATDLHVVLPFDPNDIAKNFNIFFTARNGSFSQLLRFKKVNTTWFMATKVEMGKVMYEEVQVGYPRNASGQVDW